MWFSSAISLVSIVIQSHFGPSMRTDYGVRRLVSGMWQSFIRYGGSYLPVGTFASAEMAAHASDMYAFSTYGLMYVWRSVSHL